MGVKFSDIEAAINAGRIPFVVNAIAGLVDNRVITFAYGLSILIDMCDMSACQATDMLAASVN